MKRNRNLNTNEFAKDIFENGFSEFNYQEFVAFAKYANTLGWTKEKIEKEIIRQCSEKDDFNLVLNYETINVAISKRKYSLLIDINEVWITQKELDFFKSIPENYAKILFVVLIMAKRDNNPDYYNYDLLTAKKLSGVGLDQEENNLFNHWCGSNGYLLAIRNNENNWNVCYCDKDIDGEKVLCINEFEKVIKFFPKWCQKCGKIVEKDQKKYCLECSKIVRFEKERARKR